jgi:hypothetical protein
VCQQGDEVFPAAEIDEDRIAMGGGMAAAAVTAIGMHGHGSGGRFDPGRRPDLHRQAILMTGPVDADLIADKKRGQQRQRAEPPEIHAVGPPRSSSG